MTANKRLLSAVIVCAMSLSCAYADSTEMPTESPAATSVVMVEVTSAPVATVNMDTATQTPNSTNDEQGVAATTSPTVTATMPVETTAVPTATPTLEATSEPETTPLPDTTAIPETTPVPEITPTPETTPVPETTPTPEPVPTPGTISENGPTIAAEGDVEISEGVTKIVIKSPEGMLVFRWTCSLQAQKYYLYTADSAGTFAYLGTTTDVRLELGASGYMNGRTTLYVGAVYTNETGSQQVAWGKLEFEVTMQGGGGPGGGSPGGGRPSGSAPSGSGGEDQGFQVTPGKALTSSHTSGTKDMRLYGTVTVSGSEDAMTRLTMDEDVLNIVLSDDTGFTVQAEEGTLILTAVNPNAIWQVGGDALRTLHKSGVSEILLVSGADTFEIQTEMVYSGKEYGKLCAMGYVSKDYIYQITGGTTVLTVGEKQYETNENGELLPLGA